jgi:tetratricopeptide (TPR) repeat protein
MSAARMRTIYVFPLLLASATVWAASSGASTEFGRAEELYQRADYRAALSMLLAVPAKTAAGYALIGKAYYMDGEFRNATNYLEKAVAQDSLNSDYYDWLGKAYGRRAEEASLLAAFSYAKRTRHSFEKAAALDPKNLEALGDLFEYYLQAPAIVGGGVEKAESVALSIGRLDQPEYHYALARLAEKRQDLPKMEKELRTAMKLAPGEIGRIIDLARFLYKQGCYEESEELFRRADQIAPASPKLVFARAAAYIDTGRNLGQAKALLHRYAELPITPDDPPRSESARLLGKASR